MKLPTKTALVIGVLVMAFAPAAWAAGKPENLPNGHSHTGGEGKAPSSEGKAPEYTPAEPTPGPKAGMPAKAKAYGRYCKGESRKHEKGEKGTAFSRCVTNMAQAAVHEHMAPGRVCKEESRKHEKGEKGTAFSRCVKNVAQLRRQEKKEEHEESASS